MADMSTSGSSFGNLCWQPLWTICSASFHPWSVGCWNISWIIMRHWGLSVSHWSVPQGTVQHPSPTLPLGLPNPPWLTTLWWQGPCPFCFHTFMLVICGIYRQWRSITLLEADSIAKEGWNIRLWLGIRQGKLRSTTSNNFHITTTCHFLVQVSSDYLLTYFTMFQELTIISIYL